jgi:hypothetical protein
MRYTKHDKEIVAHNIISNLRSPYARNSGVYLTTHAGLLKLSMKELEALFRLSLCKRN